MTDPTTGLPYPPIGLSRESHGASPTTVLLFILAIAVATFPACAPEKPADKPVAPVAPLVKQEMPPAAPAPQPKDPVSREAMKWRLTVIREVRYWWGMAEPRDTFAGQLHQESAWNEGAVSPVGAGGLGQVMPATAAWMGKLWPKDLQPVDVMDGHWSIRACVKYDHWLWDRFSSAASREDRWGLSLAAYNGGIGSIQKEARLAPDPPRWYGSVENVCLRRASACAESRGYVRNIWFRWRPLYANW